MIRYISIISILISTAFASIEVSDDKTSVKYSKTKELLDVMKSDALTSHTIVTDYFKAKISKKDISNDVSVKEVKYFTSSMRFGFLLSKKIKNQKSYDLLLKSHNFLNCGSVETKQTLCEGIGRYYEGGICVNKIKNTNESDSIESLEQFIVNWNKLIK